MSTITDKRRSTALTFVLIGVIIGPMAVAADAEHPAQTLIRETTSQITAMLDERGASLRDDPQQLEQLVDEFIRPHINIERIARRVLSKHWKTADPEQRMRFISAFQSMIVRTYATALNEYKAQTITYRDPEIRKDGHEVIVQSRIQRVGGQPITVAYGLSRNGEDWKLFDVSIDGVSLVMSYRASFRSEVSRNGIDGLNHLIETKNEAVVSQ